MPFKGPDTQSTSSNLTGLLHVTPCETGLIKSWLQSVSDNDTNFEHVILCFEDLVNPDTVCSDEWCRQRFVTQFLLSSF